MNVPDPLDSRIAKDVARVVVTGSECTGKTMLSQSLAERLDALWVPEYARAYAESVARPLTPDDVDVIARGQIAIEDAGAATAPAFVVQDTDIVSTVVYARHYYGVCPDWIVAAARRRLAPLYLLSDVDIPWVHDDIRDRPYERNLMDALFRATLAEFGANAVRLSGLGTHRLHNALTLIGDWRNGLL